MSRAVGARRERLSRLSLRPRRPAGPASSPSFLRFLSRLALAALLFAGAAGFAAPASAVTLVANVDQDLTKTGSIPTSHKNAQGFATGANTGGYVLSQITIYSESTTSSLTPPDVDLYSKHATKNEPGSKLADLTAPGSVTRGADKALVYTAPDDTTLDADTTYFLVIEGTATPASNHYVGFYTGSPNGEDSGSQSGWSIHDTMLYWDSGDSAWQAGQRALTNRVTGTDWSVRLKVEGTVSESNAAPTASDGTVETNEDVDYTFDDGDFNFSDTDAGDTLESVKIQTLPATGKGTLKLDGTAIAAADLPKTVTKTEIDNNKLVYDPPDDENGNDYASFTFKVNDGDDDSASAYTMTIDVDSVPDVTPPLAVTSTPKAGTTPKKYGRGEKIQVTATFDEAVTVTGDPVINLTVGTNTRAAAYASGSGSTALVFEYTVVRADTDSDGVSIAANALTLDGNDGIADSDGNAADVSHAALGAQSGHQVDGNLTADSTPPTVSSAEVTAAEPKVLVVTFSEALKTSSLPTGAGGFTVYVGGNAGPAVAVVRPHMPGGITDATKLRLLLREALDASQTGVTLDYTKPGSNPLKDAADNELADFTDEAVTNNAPACPSGQPSEAFWTACLKVGGAGASSYGFSSSGGSLSPATFTQTGSRYTIDALVAFFSKLELSFGSNPRPAAEGWMLQVGDRSHRLDERADYRATPHTYRWADISVGWDPQSVGDKVSVSLRQAPPRLTFTPSAVTVAEGGTATYEVALSWAPAASVTVAIASGDIGAATVSPASLTFTTSNWNTAQTVTVTGVNDADTNDETVTLTHSGTGVVAGTVTATVTEPDITAPSLVSAAVTGTSLVLTFDEDLAAAASLANGAFTVKKTPAGGSQARASLTGTPAIGGRTVTLTLASVAVATDTVTVSYTRPGSGSSNKLEDASGNEVASFRDRPVPVLTAEVWIAGSGTREVGGTLEARYAGVDAEVSWQWVRQDDAEGAGAVDIAGATSHRYTPVAADEGKWLAVKMSYTSGGSTTTLKSDSTGSVRGPVFDSVKPFVEEVWIGGADLTMVWSEALRGTNRECMGEGQCRNLSFSKYFTVKNGGTAQTVVLVRRSKNLVTIGLKEPVGHGDTVTVSYEPPDPPSLLEELLNYYHPIADLRANGAKKFTDRAVENRTPAPPDTDERPRLWIEDAEATESDGGKLVFKVRLSKPLTTTTANNAAFNTEGMTATTDDYLALSEQWTLPTGKTEFEVEVTLKDDALPERSETVLLKMSRGAANVTLPVRVPSGGARAIGTIHDDGDVSMGVPGALRAAPGSGQVKLAWTAAFAGTQTITRYTYRQSSDGGTTWGTWTVVTGGASATTQTVTGLTNGTAYSFEVRAESAVVNGPAAGPVTATPYANVTGATGVWSATAKFKEQTANTNLVGWSSTANLYPGSTLSDTTFTHDSTSYTVTVIAGGGTTSTTVTLNTTPAFTSTTGAGLNLHVGGLVLDLDDASYTSGIPQWTLSTARTNTPFTDDNTVTVRITDGSSRKANSPATGALVITDRVRDPANTSDPHHRVTYYERAMRLTANKDAIADTNGLPATATDFKWQWLRDGAAISGATAQTYTPRSADLGKRLSVRLTFEDGDGYMEAVTSEEGTPVDEEFLLETRWAEGTFVTRVREGAAPQAMQVLLRTTNGRHPKTQWSAMPRMNPQSVSRVAKAGPDYEAIGTRFTFDHTSADWQQVEHDGRMVWQMVMEGPTLNVLSDNVLEGDEWFEVRLGRGTDPTGSIRVIDAFELATVTIEDATPPSALQVRLSDTGIYENRVATLTFPTPAGLSWGGFPLSFSLYPGIDAAVLDEFELWVDGTQVERSADGTWAVELGSRDEPTTAPPVVAVLNKQDDDDDEETVLLVLVPDAGNTRLMRGGNRQLRDWVLSLDGGAAPNTDPTEPPFDVTDPNKLFPNQSVAAPGAPLASATSGDGEVTLTWTAPEYDGTITGWELRWGVRTGTGAIGWGEWTAIAGATAETASHTVTGLRNGQSYAFELRAMAGEVEGEAVEGEATATMLVILFPATPLASELSGSVPDGTGDGAQAGDGCRVDVAVRFAGEDGGAVIVDSLPATAFTVANGRAGTPVAAEDGLRWTVPAWSAQGFSGLLRVRLAEGPFWRAGEQVFRVAGDDDCAPAARNELASLALDGLDLDPAFDTGTTAYTASADAETGQVTVTAAAVYGTASVAIAPDDADTGTDGHQVALAEGANAVTVTVTPADEDAAARTYAVTVTRAAADPDGTRAGAVALGAQSPDRGRQFFRGKSLDRANGDAVDYYSFTTDGRYELGLGVRDQSVELAVTLENADGETIGTAGPPKDPSKDQLHIEWLSQTIEPGTYYVRVEALADGATDYYIRFGLGDAPATAVPDATPADPDGTRAGAVALGAQSPDRGRQYFRDKSLDRANGDAVDYYTFTTDGRYALGLGIRGQTVELAVTLEDANGATVGTAGPPKDPSKDQLHIEWLAQTIEAGTYYIRVAALADGATGYYIRFGLTDPPPALSVADARAEEATDPTLDFAVTLDRAPSRTVTVDYATADGTAVAGADYTATSGTLTFSAGETAKTVSVPVLDDAVDDDGETLTLRLSNASGATVADGEAVGTITNSDPVQKMWLSRFGHMVGSQIVDEVSERLSRPLEGAQVTVGGQTLDLAGLDAGQALTGLAQTFGEGGGVPVTGSSFHVAFGTEGGGPGMVAWGRVASLASSMQKAHRKGAVHMDNEVVTGIFGLDRQWSRGIAGVALSVSEGRSGFAQQAVDDSGAIEGRLTAVSPYAQLRLGERLQVWSLAGFGTGEMTIRQDNESAPELRSDIGMHLGAVGMRGDLARAGEAGGLDLAVRADAFLVQMESAEAPVAAEAETSRLRVMLDASRTFRLDGGASLAPGLELGLRQDGGDTESGAGVEIGAGLAYEHARSGLKAHLRARSFISRSESDYEEWGVSGSLHMGADGAGRGFLMSLAPTLGAASSGVNRLWSAHDASDLAANGDFEAEGRFDAEIGYGLPAFGVLTGTPYAGLGLSESGRDWRLGWRLTPGNAPLDLSFGVEATLTQPANDNAPGYGAMLRGAIRW